MDLIYADENRIDQGVMGAYELDMAYGSDENNFTCTIDRESHCCTEGFFLYVEGEEYGGIIDKVKVNTEKDEITYSGRTWHGILKKKIICPEDGQDYAVFDGEANTVLQTIIDMIDLGELFEVSAADTGIQIQAFQMDRYIDAYTGICKMLKDADAKLHIAWENKKVVLSAQLRQDYSQDEEFNTAQVDFTIEKNYRPVNHIICLGQGDLKDRAVIHIFCDENGGIQPYATKDIPLQDSDYILGISKKVMTGENEVVEILDYPNAEITENYILLNTQPSDWKQNSTAYFFQDDNDKFKEVEEVEVVTLIIFMVIDYISGLVVAGIFHKSNKSENGALESRAGWKGLCRKCVTLLFVLIAYRLDLAIGVDYIRNAVIIGFMANELISIVENAGLMGIPLPGVIQNAIEILTQKAQNNEEK